MRPISLNVLSELFKDGFCLKCCICGFHHVVLHHNFIFGGRQVDEAWAIIPVCNDCHSKANEKGMREKMDWVMLSRAKDSDLVRFSKVVDLIARKRILIEKYGKYIN
jgi:hypothetical protein